MEEVIKLEKQDRKSGRAKTLDILSFMAGIGVISIICYSFIIQSALFAGATIFVAFTATFLGGLIGFIFAIPKTNQSQINCKDSTSCDIKGLRKESNIQYKFNTNLEQISDWLTKILIGVGLTQINSLTKILYRTAEKFVLNMDITGRGAAFVVTTTFIYFMTCGFMIGYLWTRLYYHGMLAIADRGVIDTISSKINNRISSKMAEVKQEVKQEVEKTVKQDVERTVKHDVNTLKNNINNANEKQINEVKKMAERATAAAIIGVGKTQETDKIALLEEGFGKTTLGSITNFQDPNNGRFGGKAEANDRKLTAEITPQPNNKDLFNLLLCVESTNPAKPLSGTVRFYLHDSFNEPIYNAKVTDGKAILNQIAFRAFTVGAIADNGETLLELNLRDLPDAPKNFKKPVEQ